MPRSRMEIGPSGRCNYSKLLSETMELFYADGGGRGSPVPFLGKKYEGPKCRRRTVYDV